MFPHAFFSHLCMLNIALNGMEYLFGQLGSAVLSASCIFVLLRINVPLFKMFDKPYQTNSFTLSITLSQSYRSLWVSSLYHFHILDMITLCLNIPFGKCPPCPVVSIHRSHAIALATMWWNRGMDPKVLAPEGFLICSSSGIKEMFGKVIFVVKSKLQYTMLDANTLTILALWNFSTTLTEACPLCQMEFF